MRSHVRNAELLTVRRVSHTVNYIACIFDVLCNNLITSTYLVYLTTQLSHLLESLVPRPRPASTILQAAKSWACAGPGNEAISLGPFLVLFLFEHSQLPNPAFRYSELVGKVKIFMHYF